MSHRLSFMLEIHLSLRVSVDIAPVYRLAYRHIGFPLGQETFSFPKSAEGNAALPAPANSKSTGVSLSAL